MKEGKNMKLIKRITAYLLTFSILLSIGSSVVAAAVAPVEQEYPAHEDPSQEMLTDLEQKGVQINHVKDSSLITNIKNPSNGTLSIDVKHFSPKYVITANYTTGNSRIKTVYEDSDNATSTLVTAITSKAFVWTQSELDKYNTAQTIGWWVTFGTVTAISISLVPLLGVEGVGAGIAEYEISSDV